LEGLRFNNFAFFHPLELWTDQFNGKNVCCAER
jgi:hypothetical protein